MTSTPVLSKPVKKIKFKKYSGSIPYSYELGKGVVEVKKLTKDIDCDWCDAMAGEPCRIQHPVGYVGHPTDYRLGNDKTYFKQEVIHLCRAK